MKLDFINCSIINKKIIRSNIKNSENKASGTLNQKTKVKEALGEIGKFDFSKSKPVKNSREKASPQANA